MVSLKINVKEKKPILRDYRSKLKNFGLGKKSTNLWSAFKRHYQNPTYITIFGITTYRKEIKESLKKSLTFSWSRYFTPSLNPQSLGWLLITNTKSMFFYKTWSDGFFLNFTICRTHKQNPRTEKWSFASWVRVPWYYSAVDFEQCIKLRFWERAKFISENAIWLFTSHTQGGR